jgi:ArsR family transcriptional regulator, virulence genes transcriptional regulator
MNLDPAAMRESADRAAELLKSLGHRHRLLLLCRLLDAERSVTDLSQFLGIRDSTVSQHLALLRREGLVKARREGQTIWYSISSVPAREVLAALYRCFCEGAGAAPDAPRPPGDAARSVPETEAPSSPRAAAGPDSESIRRRADPAAPT